MNIKIVWREAATLPRQRLGVRRPSGAFHALESGRGLPHSKIWRYFLKPINGRPRVTIDPLI
jgi:hypothetical protein